MNRSGYFYALKERDREVTCLGFLSHQPFSLCSSESLPNIPYTSSEPPEQVSCSGPSWPVGSGSKVRGCSTRKMFYFPYLPRGALSLSLPFVDINILFPASRP